MQDSLRTNIKRYVDINQSLKELMVLKKSVRIEIAEELKKLGLFEASGMTEEIIVDDFIIDVHPIGQDYHLEMRKVRKLDYKTAS